MSTAAIIFNGIHFYQPVADAAFKRAAAYGDEVQVLFLKCKHESEEGYGFPSDMDAAENLTTGKDADAADNRIIESYIQLLGHQATAEKIAFRAQVLEDPSIQELQAALKGCTIIFMQERKKNDDTIPAGIDLEKLLHEITISIEIIH